MYWIRDDDADMCGMTKILRVYNTKERGEKELNLISETLDMCYEPGGVVSKWTMLCSAARTWVLYKKPSYSVNVLSWCFQKQM